MEVWVFAIGMIAGALLAASGQTSFPTESWQCTASHREGSEHDQHDVCDQYSRKE